MDGTTSYSKLQTSSCDSQVAPASRSWGEWALWQIQRKTVGVDGAGRDMFSPVNRVCLFPFLRLGGSDLEGCPDASLLNPA